MRFKKMITAAGAAVMILSGCSGSINVSSDEIVSNVLESGKEPAAYFGKGSYKIYSDGELTEDASFEEYADKDGKRKIIMENSGVNGMRFIAINDGKQLISYEEGSNTAQSIDISGAELPAAMTQKEQITGMLENLSGTHSYEVAGEEEMIGRDVYHLKINAKSKENLLGDMEFWVDKKTWFPIKSVSNSGDNRSEVIYESVDFSPDFAADEFKANLPEDVEIVSIDSSMEATEGTAEQAAEKLGRPILILEESLERIEWTELGGELARTEVTAYYSKDDIPSYSISTFPVPEGEDMALGGEEVTVRNTAGSFEKELRMISWDEEGLRYVLMIEHPDLSKEEVIKELEDMEPVS
ncbi:LolA family protein [Bacillus infantis]|uniref:LolA family protein n=1 Tax=Bacillus infantis TaxID=324767 RepID=UPI003CFB63BE